MPPNPPSNAHGFAMRSMSLRDMQIPKSEKKNSWPPPLPNPGDAPGIRHLAIDPAVVRLSPDTEIHVVCCRPTNPNKLNPLSWLLAYLSDKQSAWHQHFIDSSMFTKLTKREYVISIK